MWDKPSRLGQSQVIHTNNARSESHSIAIAKPATTRLAHQNRPPKLSVERTSKSTQEIEFKAKKPVTFGFEAFEVTYRDDGWHAFDPPRRATAI